MRLLAFLIILSVQMSTASKERIEQKISNMKDMMKKMKKNPNFGISRNKGASTYKIQLTIPLGSQRSYGAQRDPESARKAISMISQEYLKSLELVREGTLKSEATFKLLKLKYDKMFSKPEKNNLVSKIENIMKNIEENQNFGLWKQCHRYSIELSIPCGKKHWYGSHHNHATARNAVFMIAQEYKKSLEANSPATKEDLQKKYDAMFSKSKEHVLTLVSKFEVTLKKIEQNTNFGVYLNGRRYYIHVWIPLGERNLYGSHHHYATARNAVLMIANEYMESLRLMQNGQLESAMTFHQLKLKHDAMFGEVEKRVSPHSESNYEEYKLNIEHANKNLRMIFPTTPQKPNQTDEENEIHRDNLDLNENLLSMHRNYRGPSKKQSKGKVRKKFQGTEPQQTQITKQALRKSTSERNNTTADEKTDKNRFNKIYKIRRIWNEAENESENNFILGGYFKVMNSPDVLWVNTIKKIDGQLSGYYKEYNGCRGWVNLEYVDSTDLDELQEMDENLKRKREESEIFSGESESEESTRGSSNN